MNNESAYRLASATSAKNKADWARYQTGDGGRTKTIISVNHDEAIVLFWALKAYINHVEDLIKGE